MAVATITVIAVLPLGAASKPETSRDVAATIEVTDNGVVTVTYTDFEQLDDVSFSSKRFDIEVINATGLFLIEAENRWNGKLNADKVSITYKVKQSSTRFEVNDEWAFIPIPRGADGTTVNYVGNNSRIYQNTAYIGPYTEYVSETKGQTIHVTVASQVKNRVNEQRMIEGLARLSEDIRFGNKKAEYHTLLIPDGALENRSGYYDGRVTPTIVEVGKRTEYYKITLLHEYVHHRYLPRTGSNMSWWKEAVAQHYALEYSVKYGYITEKRRNEIAHRSDNVILGNESTWEGSAQYQKGSVVIAKFDSHIRKESENKSFQDVLQRLNESKKIRQSTLERAMVKTTNSPQSKQLVELYVNTDEMPSVWKPAPFYVRYSHWIIAGAIIVGVSIGLALYERKRTPR